MDYLTIFIIFPTKNISNEAKLFPDPGTNEYPSRGKKNIFHGSQGR